MSSAEFHLAEACYAQTIGELTIFGLGLLAGCLSARLLYVLVLAIREHFSREK